MGTGSAERNCTRWLPPRRHRRKSPCKSYPVTGSHLRLPDILSRSAASPNKTRHNNMARRRTLPNYLRLIRGVAHVDTWLTIAAAHGFIAPQLARSETRGAASPEGRSRKALIRKPACGSAAVTGQAAAPPPHRFSIGPGRSVGRSVGRQPTTTSHGMKSW